MREVEFNAKRLLIVLIVIVFAIPANLRAAASDKSSGYEEIFNKVEAYLASRPPVKPNDAEREAILKTLDAPMLDLAIGRNPAAGRFFRDRISFFIADFDSVQVASGAVIWKLYNHSTAIKTRNLTIAVDLIQGMDRISWDFDELKKFISKVDVLLITHEHHDHADIRVIRRFLSEGKSVIGPPWVCAAVRSPKGATCLREGALKLKDVSITAFPSFQGGTPNNSYLIETPDGVRILSTGDENESPFKGDEWYVRFKPPLDIDVLIPNSWCPNLDSLLEYVHPALVMSTHELEVSHPLSGRVTFERIYDKLSKVGAPFVVPFWGEKIEVAPHK